MLRVFSRLFETYVCWPSVEERKDISREIKNNFAFPNCVGMIDGTLFPLFAKPTLNGEDYFCRKGGYAITSQIICDHNRRITYLYTGWAGSVHDNRCFRNSNLNLQRNKYFEQNQYLLGDSAYTPSRIIVPAYKKAPFQELPAALKRFNTILAKVRIISEHTIGILKGRFQCLKGLRVVISRKKDMRRIIDIIQTCSVLHNLLLLDEIPTEWIELVDDDVQLNDEEYAEAEIVAGTTDETRRNEILAYVLEETGL